MSAHMKDTDPVDPDQLELVQQLNNSSTGGVTTREGTGLMEKRNTTEG